MFAMANNASMARTNANGTVEIIWDQGPYKNSIQFAQDLMNKHKAVSYTHLPMDHQKERTPDRVCVLFMSRWGSMRGISRNAPKN